MLELQDNIAKAQAATAKLRRNLVDQATQEYFGVLDLVKSPAAGDFQAAEARAYTVVKQEMLSEEAVTLVNGGIALDGEGLAVVALGFETIARPLRIPGPVALTEAKTLTLALAGAAGAVGGMLALASLMRLALDMRDLGLVVGAPLGALLAVLVVHRLARVRLLARILPWVFVRPKALRGAVRREQEKAVRMCVEQWVDWAVPLLAVLCLQRPGVAQTGTDRDKVLRKIGKLIYTLHRTGPESLPVVVARVDSRGQEQRLRGPGGLAGIFG